MSLSVRQPSLLKHTLILSGCIHLAAVILIKDIRQQPEPHTKTPSLSIKIVEKQKKSQNNKDMTLIQTKTESKKAIVKKHIVTNKKNITSNKKNIETTKNTHTTKTPSNATDELDQTYVELNPQFSKQPIPPEYPLWARERNQQGIVLLQAYVLENGVTQLLKIIKSSGYPILDKAAYKAVKHWNFMPASKNGQPITAWVQVPVKFILN